MANFESAFQYEGHGSAQFGEPLIRVAGPTIVTADERGTTVAHMQVREFPTSDSFEEGIWRLSNDLFEGIARGGGRCNLRVASGETQFIATEQVFPSSNINLEKLSAAIIFRCHRAQFDAATATAKYFRLPIWNFHGGLRPNQWPGKVLHPLRLSEDTPASSFELFGEPGFVEYVPGYREIISAQKEGDRNPRITALLVGGTGGNPTSWNELIGWFPFDFLNLLGFASGARVGAPWIEFFDDGGRLVRRVYVRLGTSLYQSGQEFMDDAIHRGGLGRLLTCAGNSPAFQKSYIRVAMNHLLLGMRGSQAMEDKISHLTGALEALATEFHLDQQFLLEAADKSLRGRVKDVLRAASIEISSLASEQDATGRADLGAALRKVAERVLSNPANIDRDFGLAVLSLLDRFGLADAAVAQAYYEENPRRDGRKWHQVLSHYRGLCQHGAAFQFDKSEASAVEVFRLAYHLADIVARLILKELGYDGEYQRATARWRDAKSPDWVTKTTPPIELGYGRGAE